MKSASLEWNEADDEKPNILLTISIILLIITIFASETVEIYLQNN